ncbi:MAG: Gfo/Idh/MocA family oxidoreductase [Nitrospinaceae bacterium]|nr:Gfo/Idh/MocA family oxidoreductase [Nitrospinaceae bacterium]MBT4092384.1 Gfo/Idh/MocA family oxidoreductase [Nitrospinaceae bacterium]MBT4431456.1 Gfo/Idh/MocA family oxidoreductase [Nitrospinaceae bacterium]MBT5367771.1 Gfo/Idh/MocA family oxidoreductase [Nitrospinaceae bacterium]MBT5946182.1 Gfo/Idh/MocA family oxidoreductase [Nitrospinaceae bacterium]
MEEIPGPVCPENGVLVQTAYSLISSGTERAALSGRSGDIGDEIRRAGGLAKKVMRRLSEGGVQATIRSIQDKISSSSLGISMGYSASGVVVECGLEVNDISVGDKVACAGEWAHHQEVLAVPRNLVVQIPEEVNSSHAAFSTLGAIAMQGVRQTRPQLGETVVVIGLGLVGQITVQLLRAAGCRVIGCDADEARISLARELGLHDGVLSGSNRLADMVRVLTGGIGADAVILCASTESSEPAQEAMKITRQRGRVVVVGLVGMNLEREPFYKKEIEFTISCSYGPGRYDPLYEVGGVDYPAGYVRWTENRNMEEFIRLLNERLVDVAPLIQGEYPLLEAQAAYGALAGDRKPIAVLLSYPQAESFEAGSRMIRVNPPPRNKKNIQVAVIGAGEFAQYVHLPNLKKIDGVHLRAVMNQRGEKAKEAARRFGAEYCTTNPSEIFNDNEIDAVLISTRHHLHAPLAVEAAKAGKDIFLEKPMGLSVSECREVANAVRAAGVHFMVGFNRRFAPLAVEAKEMISKNSGPWQVLYRVNAPGLPGDHWTQDPAVGGGRIVGEGCHFIDFCGWLIQENVDEVWARALPADGETVASLDSYTAAIRYRGGSVATIVFATVGNDEMPKERIEMFRGGASGVIDDFRELTLYSENGKSVSRSAQDKGHRQQLMAFFDSITGKSNPTMTLEEALQSSETALAAHASVRGAA